MTYSTSSFEADPRNSFSRFPFTSRSMNSISSSMRSVSKFLKLSFPPAPFGSREKYTSFARDPPMSTAMWETSALWCGSRMSRVCAEAVEEVLWGGEPLRGGVNCSSSTM